MNLPQNIVLKKLFERRLRQALAPSPLKGTCKCKTLETMSEEEIQALEREYGCPVRRPVKE